MASIFAKGLKPTAAAIILMASTLAGANQATAENWGHHGGYRGGGGGGGAAAAAGVIGGIMLFNALTARQRHTDWASSGYPDGSRATSVGTHGGRFVVLHDRNGNVIGREFVPGRVPAARRAAAQRRAAQRAAQRAARAAQRAAQRAARQAQRQAQRKAGHRKGTYAAGYDPATNRTTVSFYDRQGNRVTRAVQGHANEGQIRNIVGGN